MALPAATGVLTGGKIPSFSGGGSSATATGGTTTAAFGDVNIRKNDSLLSPTNILMVGILGLLAFKYLRKK